MMASRTLSLFGLIVLVLASLPWDRAAAQPPSSCTPALASLSSCFNFISGNMTAPTPACCSQLASVVQASPKCVCSVLNGTGAPSFNQTLVLALPGACNVTTAPLGQCNAVANAPSPVSAEVPKSSFAAASPATAHAPESSNRTPATSTTSPSGSKSVPSTNGSTTYRSSINGPLHLMLLVLFLASCTSTFKGF
ncbi:hypothetical protein MLD38_016020 [Melastoma candidum]|uniref:Uncharacterized protein n=1 Tax=Melastoma candidum TaxID=119954 RepID=A0ACB9RM89_9MYRT|nr:hypothetical protein MLD38_016020 [Melastoma candidum]